MSTGDTAKDGVLVYQGDGNYLRGCHHCDKQSHQGHDWQGTEAERMSVGTLRRFCRLLILVVNIVE